MVQDEVVLRPEVDGQAVVRVERLAVAAEVAGSAGPALGVEALVVVDDVLGVRCCKTFSSRQKWLSKQCLKPSQEQ